MKKGYKFITKEMEDMVKDLIGENVKVNNIKWHMKHSEDPPDLEVDVDAGPALEYIDGVLFKMHFKEGVPIRIAVDILKMSVVGTVKRKAKATAKWFHSVKENIMKGGKKHDHRPGESKAGTDL